MMRSWMLAARHASYTSSSVTPGRAYLRLYMTLSLKSTVSCGTTPTSRRNESMVTSRTSWSSMRMLPRSGL